MINLLYDTETVSHYDQRSMLQASTAAHLILTEVFGIRTCSPQGLILGVGLARIETNIFISIIMVLGNLE